MKLYTVPGKYDIYFETEILGKTIARHMADSLRCELTAEIPQDEDFIAAYIPLPFISGCSGKVMTVDGKTALAFFPAGMCDIAAPEGDSAEIDGEEAFAVTNMSAAVRAQDMMKERINKRHLDGDVFIQNPSATYISPDAVIGRGTVILDGCHIYGKSIIGNGCMIGPGSVIKDCIIGDKVTVNASQTTESTIGDGTTVGPFAYIRPGCVIGKKVKIGDFVELKKAMIGDGTKLSHLTYMGDAELGKNINIGCGVVAVNYDGKNKHKTVIRDNSFVGCNVNLVAPVEVGEGAYIAAGSTITDYVEPESLAIARSRQTVKPGWMKNRSDLKK